MNQSQIKKSQCCKTGLHDSLESTKWQLSMKLKIWPSRRGHPLPLHTHQPRQPSFPRAHADPRPGERGQSLALGQEPRARRPEGRRTRQQNGVGDLPHQALGDKGTCHEECHHQYAFTSFYAVFFQIISIFFFLVLLFFALMFYCSTSMFLITYTRVIIYVLISCRFLNSTWAYSYTGYSFCNRLYKLNTFSLKEYFNT